MNDYHQLIANTVTEQSKKLGRLVDYIEVGVLTGNSADAVLSTCKVRNAVLIDNWSLQTPPTSKEQVEERLAKFASVFDLIEGESGDILPDISEKFDIGFVDGDHSQEGCLSDMGKMLPLLRQNGIMFVHDTSNPNFPYLKELVINFARENKFYKATFHEVMNGLAELTPR